MYYGQGLAILDNTISWGIGQAGYSNYPLSVFKYPAIAKDLLPGIDYPIYSEQAVQSMLDLAQIYLKTGDKPSAIQFYQRVLQVEPANATALAQVAQLSSK